MEQLIQDKFVRHRHIKNASLPCFIKDAGKASSNQ
jgi:hypothetical protein